MRRKLRRFHFVGVGGIGMAALAELLHARGHEVSGSDLRSGATTRRLESLGVPVTIGHDTAAAGKADCVVRSSAIPADDPELETARRAGIPIVARGALLAEVMRKHDGIAVAGSHGKTTTSAMIAHALAETGVDPVALVGGRMPRPDGTAGPTRLGAGEWLVAEVDESDGSFLWTRPVIAVVTNVDPEHLDHYGDRAALQDAFVRFANGVPFWGAAILGIDHPGVAALRPRLEARCLGYGESAEAELRIEHVEPTRSGQHARLRLPDGEGLALDLPMPGRHNVWNATAALAVGLELDLDPEALARALSGYPGVTRRFERKGRAGGVELIDDYAHHPAELRATLAAARSVHTGPITAIFQPHRYTRTRDCWDEFAEAFAEADRVILADVYAAGEAPIPGIDAERLAEAIGRRGHPDASHGGPLERIAEALPARLREGELVLTLGAGDVVELGPRLLAALGAAPGGGDRRGRDGRETEERP